MTEKFYLGKFIDPSANKISDQQLLYDPDDLTTHAVVTGMTGSGKTGLCINIMEEAALQGITAILVDPKGDLTNLLLHFPDLAPQDFQPWLDPELARRAGNVLGLFGGRRATRRLSSSLSKHRFTEQAKDDVEESVEALDHYDQELAQLEAARQQAHDLASGQWGDLVNDILEIPVLPRKTDIYVNLFGVAWLPYYQVQSGDQTVEISAFGA